MCGRHFCKDCGEEMIHRDNRQFYESSSALGQIISRSGPRSKHFGGGDVDFYWHEGRRSSGVLLRLLEHKQPNQEMRYSQRVTLMDLAMVIDHCIMCPTVKRRLDPESGVFVIRGEVGAEDDGRHKTYLKGPQEVERWNGGYGFKRFTITTQAAFFVWLECIPTVLAGVK